MDSFSGLNQVIDDSFCGLFRVGLSFEPDRLLVTIENGPENRATQRAAEARGEPSAAARGLGVGIVGMEERAIAIGGTLRAGPVLAGFRVAADLPYRRTS